MPYGLAFLLQNQANWVGQVHNQPGRASNLKVNMGDNFGPVLGKTLRQLHSHVKERRALGGSDKHAAIFWRKELN
jgi:hypothetical protein